ncbi:MAG: 7-cyano-7-deazaguanine synthase [Candidatus Micrarchaeota archaeon]
MDKSIEQKMLVLRQKIRKLDSALVAFSGGVDSTFLMRICREELGDKAVAVTSITDDYPSSEIDIARQIAKIVGVTHIVLDRQSSLKSPRFGSSKLYSTLKSVAMRMKLKNIINGFHLDDLNTRSMHLLAAKQAKVKSPLLESNLSKAEIYLLAKELGTLNLSVKSKRKHSNNKRKKK